MVNIKWLTYCRNLFKKDDLFLVLSNNRLLLKLLTKSYEDKQMKKNHRTMGVNPLRNANPAWRFCICIQRTKVATQWQIIVTMIIDPLCQPDLSSHCFLNSHVLSTIVFRKLSEIILPLGTFINKTWKRGFYHFAFFKQLCFLMHFKLPLSPLSNPVTL